MIPQRTVSFYEREAGDILAGPAPPMARPSGVPVDELLGETDKRRRADAGRTGRMCRLFEAASKLVSFWWASAVFLDNFTLAHRKLTFI
jgi:hypothetical protein